MTQMDSGAVFPKNARNPESELSRGYPDSVHNVKRYLDTIPEPSDARIGAQLGFMQAQINETKNLFGALVDRIEQILIPELEEKNKAINEVPRKMASELSNTIDDLNYQFSRLQERIANVTARVQL